MSPSCMNIPSTSYRCRSEPQMPLEVIRTTASVGCWMLGSATLSTRTSRLPCHVTAFMRVGVPVPRIGQTFERTVAVACIGVVAARPTKEADDMQMNSLNDVLTEQLGDLYSAEQQLVEAL